MNRLRKRLWLLPLVALSGGLVASCNRAKSNRTFGFAQEGAESKWRKAETESVKSEANRRGAELKFSDAGGDQDKQVKAMRAFIAQQVDGIILAPKVTTGWDDVLKEAKDKKIPVVLVDRGVGTDSSFYTTLIASDFVEEGRRAAEWMAKHSLEDADWKAKHSDGHLNIVELQGTAGSQPATERKQGFTGSMSKHPGMQIIDTQDGNFEIQKGKDVMSAFLKKHGEKINAVYAHNDDMAIGAIQAIEEDGRFKPGKDIIVVSIDGNREALKAIFDGKLNCSVECNPLLGPDAFDALDAAILGKDIPKRKVEKDELFDATNVTPELIGLRNY
jgi:simple sugar transport system substrate-binding protein